MTGNTGIDYPEIVYRHYKGEAITVNGGVEKKAGPGKPCLLCLNWYLLFFDYPAKAFTTSSIWENVEIGSTSKFIYGIYC